MTARFIGWVLALTWQEWLIGIFGAFGVIMLLVHSNWWYKKILNEPDSED